MPPTLDDGAGVHVHGSLDASTRRRAWRQARAGVWRRSSRTCGMGRHRTLAMALGEPMWGPRERLDGKEWAGGSPWRGCKVRICGVMQAYGEGPGAAAAVRLYFSAGRAEPNPAMIRDTLSSGYSRNV